MKNKEKEILIKMIEEDMQEIKKLLDRINMSYYFLTGQDLRCI